MVLQPKNERNYHVFYQLITGSGEELLRLLHLNRDLDKYHYLTFGKSSNIDIENGEILNYLDDKNNFDQMLNALRVCNFSQESQMVLLKLTKNQIKKIIII